MNAWLSRQFYRLHERCLGRDTFAYARELEWSQWQSPADLRGLQERKLGAVLLHAGCNIPYYRTLFRDAGISDVTANPRAALSQLPFLTKSTIRNRVNDMQWHCTPGGLFQSNTGGSSGEPLQFYVDRRRQGYDQAARMRTHRWFDVEFGDRELYLWGSPIEHQSRDRLKRLRDWICNHRLISAFHMSPEKMNKYVAIWNRYGPACLFGYPSSIAMFVKHVQRQGVRLDTSNLRAVFLTGETCPSGDRQAISDFFQKPVADCYGSRDGGFIAHECPEGLMHVMAENVFLEIIANDAVQPVGEFGEIVLTHLDAYGMPFIRYRTGDMGRLLSGRCSCGRGLPLMDVVQGRSTDFIRLPDGTVRHALSVIYPLRELAGIAQFRVTQHEDYAITIDIVPDNMPSAEMGEAVVKQMHPIVGRNVPVKIKWVDQIETGRSGKNRYVVSHVKEAAATEMELVCN